MSRVFRSLAVAVLLAFASGTVYAQSSTGETAAGETAAPVTSTPVTSTPVTSAPASPTEASPAGETAEASAIGDAAGDAGAAGEAGVAETELNDVEMALEEPTNTHNLSVWGMFAQADIVVKAVMIGLVIASIITWTVAVAKSVELNRATARAKSNLARLRSSTTLAGGLQSVSDDRGTVSAIATSAQDEMANSAGLPKEGVKERLAWRLERLEAATARSMNRGTGMLATIGATAPFVGLFGTVWGIMNAFIGIAESQTTNLAVVAPGIAEALLATALGLVAAIPAVMIYNHFARQITAYRALIGDAATEVLRLVSHELDRQETQQSSRARAAE